MERDQFDYVIAGGGLAGASAIDGIRELDRNGSILLVSSEPHRPYHRPPLSKKLWFGKTTIEKVFVHEPERYRETGIELRLSATIASIDLEARRVTDDRGRTAGYRKLLLATGGRPRRLRLPGATMPGVSIYRDLDDYTALRQKAERGGAAVVIGGSFIGSELAAALRHLGLEVTMVFPGPYLGHTAFPEGLGRALTEQYRGRGITILDGDRPSAFQSAGGRIAVHTEGGRRLVAETVVVGIGIEPRDELARSAGLLVEDGIVVDETLASSHPDVYAAGDAASFPCLALERRRRIEHWDNAASQGRQAGRNLAGAGEPYSHLPYFFSDLFEFGYEAVGRIESALATFADWESENEKGVVYYLEDGRVRGAMMCNVWDRVPAARELIRSGRRMTPGELRGAIR